MKELTSELKALLSCFFSVVLFNTDHVLSLVLFSFDQMGNKLDSLVIWTSRFPQVNKEERFQWHAMHHMLPSV